MELFPGIFNEPLDKRIRRLFAPGNSISNPLTAWAKRKKPNARSRLLTDVFAKNRDSKSGRDVLDRGPRSVDFLDNSRAEPSPLAEARQPGAVTGRILTRR